MERQVKDRELARLKRKAARLVKDEAVAHMLQVASDTQAVARKTVVARLSVECNLAQALVTSSAWLALALYQNRGERRCFPADWLTPNGDGNPDVIMACLLCQLGNYGYSVVELVSRGLDTPARALLRSTAELSYIVAAISVNRDLFRSYILEQSESPKRQWYKLFSGRKLAAQLAKADKVLGLSEEWTRAFRDYRRANTEFFSEAIHHSPRATLVGSQATVPGTDRVTLALLGGSASASRATLSHLIECMNYALTMFFASSDGRRGHLPQFSDRRYWESGRALYYKVQPVFLQWLTAAGG